VLAGPQAKKMDKKSVKKNWIHPNKNFPTKFPKKITEKHLSKNKAANNNIEGSTKKSTPQKPPIPKISKLKVHWLNNPPIPSTTSLLLLKKVKVLSVV
jgi:hypothetical protein